MKTSLYVDGFNFYYGCFRQQKRLCVPADKWLNWRLLAERIAGRDSHIHKVHYFTAHIHRSDLDRDQNLRQQLYFRALESIPAVELHYGKHIRVERIGRVLRPESFNLPAGQLLRVSTYEEKATDVNLAVTLLDDAWSGEVERGIVVSNDTDLIQAILLARRHIRVDVVSPQANLAREMEKAASYSWLLDPRLLRDYRMDIPVTARDGSPLYPPRSWQRESWDQPEE